MFVPPTYNLKLIIASQQNPHHGVLEELPWYGTSTSTEHTGNDTSNFPLSMRMQRDIAAVIRQSDRHCRTLCRQQCTAICATWKQMMITELGDALELWAVTVLWFWMRVWIIAISQFHSFSLLFPKQLFQTDNETSKTTKTTTTTVRRNSPQTNNQTGV